MSNQRQPLLISKASFDLFSEDSQTLEFLKSLETYSLDYSHPESLLTPRDVNVQISLCHDQKNLGILYQVKEETTKAIYTQDGQPVYKDSCVEFFIKTPQGYHNFEMNAIGTCLVSKGAQRAKRTSFTSEEYNRLHRLSSLGKTPFESKELKKEWWAMLVIPNSLLGWKKGLPADQKLQANIYKCGDELPQPHWLTLFDVPTEQPDFHRPEFFGEFLLE